MGRIDIVAIVNENYKMQNKECNLSGDDAIEVYNYLLDVQSGKIAPTTDKKNELLKITSIDLSDNNIADINPLIKLINLQKLNLRDNQITDLNPLSELINLQELNLSGNQITDITPLSNLTNLSQLDLSVNKIIKIIPLSSLTNLKALYLSRNIIDDVEKLSNLNNLHVLDLHNNKITDISLLKGLTNLEKLNLSDNQISNIISIGVFTNLQMLNLYNNKIQVTDSLNNLTKLQVLFLGGNIIEDIYNLSKMTNLKGLYLGHNKISNIQGLSKLINLQQLSLQNNAVIDIHELSYLTNLQSLHLNNNKITDISPLSKLYRLKNLYLQYNNIRDISLGELPNLQELDLRFNEINDIGSLDKLTNLKRVYLSNNPIIKLEDCFSEFRKLQYLDLSDLQIKSIPKSLVDLNLQFVFSDEEYGIRLKNTPLTEQDIRIFKGTREEILEYYKADKVKIHNAKIVFLGNGGAGKTTTIERIMIKGNTLPTNYNPERTKDINISSTNYKDRQINIWDFGGQPYMYHLHRLFLTPRTVYAIVLYSRHCHYKRDARYWLHTIKNHTKSNDVVTFLLENCHDYENGNKIDLSSLEQEFNFEHNPIIYSATKTPKEDFNKKFQAIFEKIKNFKFEVRETVSKAYDELKVISKNCLPEDEYLHILKKCGIVENKNIVNALNTFNDLGYFFSATDDTDALPEYLVLNPQWLFYNIYQIIRIAKDSTENTENGIVKVTSIQNWLSKDIEDNNELTYLLKLMQKFEIAYRFDRDYEEPKVFIPALCSESVPDALKEIVESSDGWVFEFQYSYLPDNVLYMLLVRAYKFGFSVHYAWKCGAKINIEGRNVIIKFDDERNKLSIKPLLTDRENDWYNTYKWINDQLNDNSEFNSINYKLNLFATGYILTKSKDNPTQTLRFNYNGLLDAYSKGVEKVNSSETDFYEEFFVNELLGKVLTDKEKERLINEKERDRNMVRINIEKYIANGTSNIGETHQDARCYNGLSGEDVNKLVNTIEHYNDQKFERLFKNLSPNNLTADSLQEILNHLLSEHSEDVLPEFFNELENRLKSNNNPIAKNVAQQLNSKDDYSIKTATLSDCVSNPKNAVIGTIIYNAMECIKKKFFSKKK